MAVLALLIGIALIILVLWEGFETIVLPRRVTRRFRLTRLFYRKTWLLWQKLVSPVTSARNRENLLSFYGPLSLLFLLTVWAGGLILGFALLHWAVGSTFDASGALHGFLSDLYLSGTTFFTLGLGDVTPRNPPARLLTVIECGMGFGFLALVIGYLPALNQSFSRREVNISLLDARAGSPPTAAEMLRRHSHGHGMEELRQLLHEWERWSAEFLESHISFPVLAYFRSQHENQSWLAALAAILDASALVMVGVEGACERQASLTFAMARHAVVDLALVFGAEPKIRENGRLTPQMLTQLHETLAKVGLKLQTGDEAERKLAELRLMYEPYLLSLAAYHHIKVPPWFFEGERQDNWQASAWELRKLKAGRGRKP